MSELNQGAFLKHHTIAVQKTHGSTDVHYIISGQSVFSAHQVLTQFEIKVEKIVGEKFLVSQDAIKQAYRPTVASHIIEDLDKLAALNPPTPDLASATATAAATPAKSQTTS
jgi:hypothetical protein